MYSDVLKFVVLIEIFNKMSAIDLHAANIIIIQRNFYNFKDKDGFELKYTEYRWKGLQLIFLRNKYFRESRKAAIQKKSTSEPIQKAKLVIFIAIYIEIEFKQNLFTSNNRVFALFLTTYDCIVKVRARFYLSMVLPLYLFFV